MLGSEGEPKVEGVLWVEPKVEEKGEEDEAEEEGELRVEGEVEVEPKVKEKGEEDEAEEEGELRVEGEVEVEPKEEVVEPKPLPKFYFCDGYK